MSNDYTPPAGLTKPMYDDDENNEFYKYAFLSKNMKSALGSFSATATSTITESEGAYWNSLNIPVSVATTSDGVTTWTSTAPTSITGAQYSTAKLPDEDDESAVAMKAKLKSMLELSAKNQIPGTQNGPSISVDNCLTSVSSLEYVGANVTATVETTSETPEGETATTHTCEVTYTDFPTKYLGFTADPSDTETYPNSMLNPVKFKVSVFSTADYTALDPAKITACTIDGVSCIASKQKMYDGSVQFTTQGKFKVSKTFDVVVTLSTDEEVKIVISAIDVQKDIRLF